MDGIGGLGLYKILILGFIFLVSTAAVAQDFCPVVDQTFVPSDDSLVIRRNWRIIVVEPIPEYGLSEGIVVQYKANDGLNQGWWSVVRIGHEGITRFYYWDSGGPFQVDCRGRVRMDELCPCEEGEQ